MKPRKRKLRGFEIGINEMFYGFLGMLFIFILFIAFTNTGGGLTDITNWFKDLFNMSTDSDEDDYETAKASVEALVCAINSVATGEEYTADGCSKFYGTDNDLGMPGLDDMFSGGSPGRPSGAGSGYIVSKDYSDFMTGLATGTVKGRISVECTSKPLSIDEMNNIGEVGTVEVSTEGEWSTVHGRGVNECKKIYGLGFYENEVIPTKIYETKGVDGWNWDDEDVIAEILKGKFSCVRKTAVTTCDVYNFQLPQEVSKAEDWILGYGDPQFLVYYQAFPMEQDTWTFKADWKVVAGIVLVSAIPPTKWLGKGGKLVYNVIKLSTKQEAKQLLKRVMINNIMKRWVRKGLVGTGMYTAARAAELADSINAKYDDPDPGKITLKTPLQEKESFSLSDRMEGYPVMIDWKPDFISEHRVTPLHLVSPCYADTIHLKKAKLFCDKYTYNTKTGLVDCDNDKVFDRDITLPDGSKLSIWATFIDKFFGKENVPDCKIDSYLGIRLFESIEDVTNNKINTITNNIYEKAPEGINVSFENEDKLDIKSPDNPESVEPISEEYIWDFAFQGGESGGSGAERSFDLSPDAVSISHKIRIESEEDLEKKLYLIDSDFDDYFDSYSLENCNIDVVFIEDFERKEDVKDYNYCVDDRGGYEKTLEWGGAILATGGIVTAGFLTGGWAWVMGGLAVLGTGIEVAGVYEDYSGAWPGDKPS